MQIRLWKYIFIFLLLILSLLTISIFQLPDSRLHLIACDVGEGDATLLIYKNIQILVDGGPDKRVLTCLGKYLPFWDRNIELVVLTHPDRDHFTGLIDVFRSYRVVNFLYNPITVSKPEYKVLEKEVGSARPHTISPCLGQRLRLDLIYLDIFNPSNCLNGVGGPPEDAKEVSDNKTNQYSIVSLVSFGKFRALLTGDMTPEVSNQLAVNPVIGLVQYIKIPHHGSKNGLTDNLLKAIEPKIAVISVGKNNYGHPAPEIIKMLNENKVKTFRTDESGSIEVIVDLVNSTFQVK